MNPIQIVKAGLQDLSAVQKIATETFFDTFAKDNTEADMQKYLAENLNEGKLASELSNPQSGFFIAWDAESPVGYLKINSGQAQTELREENSLEIERIYVKSDYHGKKVGQILYEKALEIALLEKKDYLWLGVWENNSKAIRFYEKNGFVVFDKHIFKFGEDEQTDVMMKKILK